MCREFLYVNNKMGLNFKARLEGDGEISCNVYDIGIGLGFTQIKKGKIYIRYETINSYLKEFGFSQQVGKDDYIPEGYVNLLAMKAKNKNAVEFQKWIAFEVLPSLRKNNYYIDKENINQEQLSKLQKELEETKNKLKDLRKDLDSLYLPFRNLGKSRREQFQKIIEDNLPSKPCAVAEITNLIYKNILGMTAREFKEELGVESVREELTARELRLIEKAEELTMCFVFIQAFYGVDDDLIMAKLRYLLDTVEFVV